jgi:aspartate/methionine/tyrosine aminotransferase
MALYRRNRLLLLNALSSLGLDTIAPPDGAFYVYANVQHLTDDSVQFCIDLLRETGMATAPGVDFDPVDGRHFMRMSFAASKADIEEAIRRLAPWLNARQRLA